MGRRGASVTSDTVYAYRAARADGAIERGVLSVDSREAAASALMNRGLFPMDVRLERASTVSKAALPPDDLAVGLRVLAALLEANVPLARALGMLDDLVPASWTPVLGSITESIRSGHSLAAALSSAPASFPPVVLGMLQAGEGGSGLATAVRRAADLTESTARTRAAIRSALAYPIILAFAGTASIALLVGVVLPRFGAILSDLGQPLPLTTRLALELASFARVAALPAFALLLVSIFLWRAWVGTSDGARRWASMMLAVPAIGAIRRSSATARACAALSALLESGVPFAQALVHGARATGDAEMSARILAARESIIGGQSVAKSLGEQHALTPTAVRLARAGEETGRLADMLAHAATLEADAASRSTKTLVGILEPAMILVFGAIVAFVAASLLQAIYSVRPT